MRSASGFLTIGDVRIRKRLYPTEDVISPGAGGGGSHEASPEGQASVTLHHVYLLVTPPTAIQLQLQQRRTRQQLADQGIMPREYGHTCSTNLALQGVLLSTTLL